jgi:hypothetical protein
MLWGRYVLVAVVWLLFLCRGTFAAEIALSPSATGPLKRACERLGDHVGELPGKINVERLDTADQWLGEEGYTISSRGRAISVRANSDAGLANGIYTLLRTMMIEDLASPFEKTWDVRDRPRFRWRSMMVAPYSFGAAHGFAAFSPDMWTLDQWREYLDYLRLFNMNRVGIYSMRLYDPAIPQTWPNKTRYETWKGAMDYAHELGMKFAWVGTANGVPQELWWRHPELRNQNEIGWRGCALCYSKARDRVRKTQRHTFEYFKDADYFTLMFSDGGGACYCDACSKDQAAVFIRITEDVQETLGEIGSDAEVIFWNWLLVGWYSQFPKAIPGYLEKYPQVKDIQKNVYERLPRDVVFEDIAVSPAVFGVIPDSLKPARQEGFETVVNFAYFMNPETSQSMFPRPLLKDTAATMAYSVEAKLDGVDGYRLSPSGRILNDFAFMRLVWNPDLSAEQLVDEMAGYLTEKKANRAKVAEAILALEAYWTTEEKDANIVKAVKLLEEARRDEPSRQLEYVADTTLMLGGVHQLSRPDISKEEADQVKNLIFAETTRRYILQGFGGTQYQWEPEARRYFDAFMGMWAPSHLRAEPAD